jgi:hypothetical protein
VAIRVLTLLNTHDPDRDNHGHLGET